ncbi:MAG TPA: SUMF1/EgtB/PvdO family nonheme iron enzyme [Stellaceae bacterium]|jgi:formylglycine-generating enzyme required for sulfatase activity/class 3 adenylate cyclase|nr:SUMF1/EgtB/PvdO family nonheme iron enzyme [Stellaceae bacterium]
MPGDVYRIEQNQGGGGGDHGPARRLAAILAADIVGYSRLMGMDEEGTHARIKRQRRDLIDPTIAEHHGRLIKNTGDGFLVMFDSPVEAVRCAIVIQQSMAGRNAGMHRSQWIQYRIGVNLGDVIVESDDIYGDGVNVASRLETLAQPGTVYISGGVYEQIKNKLVCGYQSLGDQRVKNITDPVSVYRVLPDPGAVAKARQGRGLAIAGALVACTILGVTAYLMVGRQMLSPPAAQVDMHPPPAQPVATAEPPAQATAPATTAATTPAATTPAATPAPAPTPPASEAIVEPEMVALPAGALIMGSNDELSERPPRRVTLKPFALGKYPVTVRAWKACVAANACKYVATGDDEAPVTNVSWSDAKQFTAWLSRATQKDYRLPSEAEWEYAARGGSTTRYWWGNHPQLGLANCKGCNEPYDAKQPLKVGSFLPNPFGLYDMGGGVDQWVEDCWHKNYQGAPADGTPWLDADCSAHVLRGGSWKSEPGNIRTASRDQYDANVRYLTHGLRVARTQ